MQLHWLAIRLQTVFTLAATSADERRYTREFVLSFVSSSARVLKNINNFFKKLERLVWQKDCFVDFNFQIMQNSSFLADGAKTDTLQWILARCERKVIKFCGKIECVQIGPTTRDPVFPSRDTGHIICNSRCIESVGRWQHYSRRRFKISGDF